MSAPTAYPAAANRSARQLAPLAATTRYVKAGASGNGSSWSNASNDLQDMINASAAGDQVWIAGGTYKPSTTGLTDDRRAAFSLKNGVSVLGGFSGVAGTEGNDSTRTAMPSSTTLSGDIGTVGNVSDNCYNVVHNFHDGIDNSAVLDGVVITGGNADGDANDPNGRGGGMSMWSVSPSINQCLFTQNKAIGGGGLEYSGSSMRLTNSSFVNNSATQGGGANLYGTTNVVNCYFTQNTGGLGGAVATVVAIQLTNCTFSGNSSGLGGAVASPNGTATLENCLLWNNGGANSLYTQGQPYLVRYTALEASVTSYTNGGNNQTLTTSPFDNATGPALKACAPAVDAGNVAANTTTTDVLGNARKVRTIDIGAAEFQGTPTQPATIVSQSQSVTTVCGTTTQGQFMVTPGGTGPFTLTFFRDNTQLVQATNVPANSNTTSNPTLSQSGNYQFVVTSACNSVTTTYAPITGNPLPTQYNVTGGGAYCAGGPGLVVGLAGSQTGVNYQLLRDGNAVGSPLAGTGSGLSFGNQTVGGTYTIRATNATTSCQQTMSGSASVTVNPLPTQYAVTGGGAYCAGGAGSPVGLSGSQTEVNYQLLRGNTAVGSPLAGTGNPISFGPQSTTGTYSVQATNATTSCSQSMSGSVSVTINPLPTPSIVGLPSSVCQDAGILPLTGNPPGGSFTIDGATASGVNAATLAVGDHNVVYRYTDANGCSNTAVQTVTIKATPPTPTLLTQMGQLYPGGQANVTVDVNSGNVNLVVGNCSGTINWTGPSGSSGSNSPIVVSTVQVGRFVYTATCTVNGCTSAPASATVTVQGRLTVLHRDVDNYADNNAVQPLLQLQNQGSTSLPLSKLTLRYYLTVEGSAPLSNLFVFDAQVGSQNVKLNYVAPTQAGGQGYVEVGFTAGAGSLSPGANSGNIRSYFAKSDYSSLFEPDDYSYNPVRDQLTATQRITAYYDGVLIAGIEPGSGASVRSLRALTESKNGPSATQISTFLEVRNEGTVAVNYSDLKARYYFTSDGAEPLLVEVDEGNVSTQLVAVSPAVSGANYYLEIRYNQGGQLAPGASMGRVRYRISKPQGGRFDQSNDYSYQEQPQDRSQNSHVVVLVGSELVWGTPPAGANARIATSGQEPGAELTVRVLGNPIQGDQLRVAITGAQGQPLHLSVSDLSGRVVAQQQVESAGLVEEQSLNVSQTAAGLLLLQVSSPSQSRTVKVIKGQ